MTDDPFDAPAGTPAQPDQELAAGPAVPPRHRLGRSELIGEAEVHLLDYLKVIHKRRWTAATAFLIVVGSVTVYTFTATPMFSARTRLLIEAENQNVVSFKAVLDGDQTRADYYQTQYNILQSRALARRTLDELKLWDTPPFAARTGQSTSLTNTILGAPGVAVTYVWRYLASGFGQSVESGDPIASAKVNTSASGTDETADQSRAIDQFASNLTVAPIRNSRLVDLKYELPDAGLATNIVNTLANKYIEQSLEFKFMASKEASDWLGQRLGEQRGQLEQSEAKLQRYREQNDAISLKDRENIVVQKLSDLNGAVTQAKTERFQKEALYRQLESLRGNSSMLDTFPAILTNTFIQQQKTELAQAQSQYAQMGDKLGERHPDMVKLRSAIQVTQTKVDGEIGKVVQGVKNEYLAALAKENSLAGALNAQKGDALTMNRKAIDYSVLDRDVQSGRQLYDNLLQRAKETGVSSELKTSNIRIVDRAERPLKPVSPQKGLNLLLALVGGAALSVGLTFFFEYLDDRIKRPDEVQAHLGLPFIGMVPALFEKHLTDPLMSNAVPVSFAEAFRAIRTNVLFSSADEGPKVMVVTSSAPGEGKTLVATNLSVALAQANQRVLIVDGDMRKPRVHGIFKHPQAPGLSNVLVGNAKPSEAVRHTKVPGLWAMPAGVIPPNPSELLGSKRFKEFVGSLGQHFDWVIIDSPPIMAVTDSSVVAHVATGVVFVIGSEMTSRHTALRSLDQLRNANAKVVGAILNRVDLKHHGYYYSQYYKKAYADYYVRAAS